MNEKTYFVNHMLQEQRRKNSAWKPYIDVLPEDVSGFPTYFGEAELALLKGSPTLSTNYYFNIKGPLTSRRLSSGKNTITW